MSRENQSEIKVNIIELATELAHMDVCALYDNKVYINSNENTRYKRHIQPIFDDLYDTYYTIIERAEVKNG